MASYWNIVHKFEITRITNLPPSNYKNVTGVSKYPINIYYIMARTTKPLQNKTSFPGKSSKAYHQRRISNPLPSRAKMTGEHGASPRFFNMLIQKQINHTDALT